MVIVMMMHGGGDNSGDDDDGVGGGGDDDFIYLFIYLASPIITQSNNTYTQPFLSNPKTRKLQRNVHDFEIKPRMV